MYPQEFLYTKEHEWIRVDESIGTIGITDYAQKELGDVVYVELPKPGDQITANESFGTVESVKAVSDLFAPVSGEVTSVNTKLQNNPELLNADPHGEAWLIRVRLTDHAEVEKLMTADEYENFIKGEKAH
ncbi:MAG TPA: glycine cleavage system protein GcvH [Terriglobia bacterium]|jgi:glycine cleavage system H protein|nr:glycine cleavage system protein GcvH [Terriglobia bacterium]